MVSTAGPSESLDLSNFLQFPSDVSKEIINPVFPSSFFLQVWSMLQLRPVEEDEHAAESLELNCAAANDDHFLLQELLSQERYRKCINQRSGWGVPSTPLRMAASKGSANFVKKFIEPYTPPISMVQMVGAESSHTQVKPCGAVQQTQLYTVQRCMHVVTVVLIGEV